MSKRQVLKFNFYSNNYQTTYVFIRRLQNIIK